MKRFLILLIPVGKWKHVLMEKYLPTEKSIVIKNDTKCLVIAPHPDDETIGCGGIMLKYKSIFDCAVLASAGVGKDKTEAEKLANVRIKEFLSVMKKAGIKNHWIFKTFGVPPMYRQIRKNLRNYFKTLDIKKYDYIFVPHPNDNHREHKYISRYIVKRLLRHNGYKRNLKICYYGIWTPLIGATHFEDITKFKDKKYDLLKIYKSQNKTVYYPDMADGLNKYYGGLSHANMKYAEAFKVVSVKQYLWGKK